MLIIFRSNAYQDTITHLDELARVKLSLKFAHRPDTGISHYGYLGMCSLSPILQPLTSSYLAANSLAVEAVENIREASQRAEKHRLLSAKL